jgi:hypothetical protein
MSVEAVGFLARLLPRDSVKGVRMQLMKPTLFYGVLQIDV